MGGPRVPAPSRTKSPPGGRRRLPFDLDRIVMMRIAIAIVVVAFLYLILKVSMIAFGGSSARGAKRIEHAIDQNATRKASAVPTPPSSEPAPAR